MEDREEKISRIEKLKRDLYSRNKQESLSRRSRLSKNNEGLSHSWKKEGEDDFFKNKIENQDMTKKKKYDFFKLILWLAVVFFVISLGVAGFVLFTGGTIISSDNIKIDVLGPLNINGGEPLELQISISNENATNIEAADLIVEYPEGTRSVENLNISLPRFRKSIGTLEQGESKNETVKALLFGEEGQTKKIKIVVEYRTENSNAIFFKEKEYEVRISSSPISINIESLKEITSGDQVNLKIEVVSNSSTIVEDLILQVDFPFGFNFSDSNPDPAFSTNIWRIGDIAPGGRKSVNISGVLEGQDGEERVFKIFTGIEEDNNEGVLKTAFSSVDHSILITKPFMSVDLVIGGDHGEYYAALPDEEVKVSVVWKNNLPDPISNTEITTKLVGEALDESSIKVSNGFYRSIDNTIVWNKTTEPSLDFINPGQSGILTFSFRSKDQTASATSNPEVSIEASVSGRRLSENQVSEEVVSQSSRYVRFQSIVELSGKILHNSGLISNSGPIPPRVEQLTTYTVVWSIKNTANNISGGQVKTVLPNYISWENVYSPTSSDITFNPNTREVVWNVGRVRSGSGVNFSAEEVSFKIGFLPSISQLGSEPILIGQSIFTGRDDFAGANITSTKRAMTTKITSDPSYSNGDEVVNN